MINGTMDITKLWQEHTYSTAFNGYNDSIKIIEESLYQINFGRVFTLIRKYMPK